MWKGKPNKISILSFLKCSHASEQWHLKNVLAQTVNTGKVFSQKNVCKHLLICEFKAIMPTQIRLDVTFGFY